MVSITRNHLYTVDLNKPLLRQECGILLAEGDNNGDQFLFALTRDGESITIDDAVGVTAYMIRNDGSTVVIAGGKSATRVGVTLPQSCYISEGRFSLAVKVAMDGVTTTVAVLDGYIKNTQSGTLIDPGSVVPTLDELLAQIEAMETATAAANTAAANAKEFIVTVNVPEYIIAGGPSGITADKTFAEIRAAITAGKTPVVKIVTEGKTATEILHLYSIAPTAIIFRQHIGTQVSHKKNECHRLTFISTGSIELTSDNINGVPDVSEYGQVLVSDSVGYNWIDPGELPAVTALAEDIAALTPPAHISNCWSIRNHQGDFMVLEHGATAPVKAYLDSSVYPFGVMNVYPGRMVYRNNVTDALFQKCTYMFRVVSVGAFEFGTKDGNGEDQGILCWVSPKEKLFKIFTSAWDGNNEIKRNLTLDFDILPGEVYVAEIVKQGLHQTTIRLSCTTDTNKKFEYTHTATGGQLNNKLRVCGGVAFHAVESTAEFKLYEMTQKVCVHNEYDLLIIGDSFVECGNTEVEASKSFAYMVREMIGEKCNASGHGGATTAKVISRLSTDANIGFYKYAFIQVGSNDSAQGVTLDQFKANMGTIISYVESKGAVPILTTIPIRTDADNIAFIVEANAWVKASGYKYVDEYTMLTSDHLLQDGIHPNETGNQLILLSLMGLIPECF